MEASQIRTWLSAHRNAKVCMSVSGLRQVRGQISMGALKVEALQLSIERRAAHAECLGGGRDVAISARKGPLQHPALGGGEVLGRRPRRTAKIGCRQRVLQASR